MNHRLPLPMLALALCGSLPVAHGTETAIHNDLDGDGRSDLIWRNAGTGIIVYWSGANPAMATTVRVTAPSGLDLRGMTIAGTGTFTYDNRSSIILRDPVSGLYPILFFNGSSYAAHSPYFWCCSPGSPLILAGVGDFDGDTLSDLFVRNPVDGHNYLLGSGAWWGMMDLAPVQNLDWKVAGVGDFNGDGRSDILWRNAVTGFNSIWRSADSKTQQYVTRVSNPAWRIAALADFNGDRKSDIFWRNTSTGANAIWYSGNSATPRATASVIDQGWQVAATGDFDGDGRFDLCWRNSRTGANVIWKSASRSARQVVAGVSNQAWSTVK